LPFSFNENPFPVRMGRYSRSFLFDNNLYFYLRQGGYAFIGVS